MKKKCKILLIAAGIILVYVALNTISIYLFSLKDQKCRADVAIILGASTSNGKVSPVYQERINHGINLYLEGYVDKLLVTGGMGEGNRESDAQAAKRYAMSQGVPETDIFTEDASRITQENLENAKAVMNQYHYCTAVIVSDPLHMRRSMLLAEDAGIRAYSSPTPTSKYVTLKTKIPFLFREVFLYIGYKWWRIVH